MVQLMFECSAGAVAPGGAGCVGGLDVEVQSGRSQADDFGRLVRLVRDNERLLVELEAVRSQARRAWAYLAEPGSNAALAMAKLERIRLKRSALLAHLRANRVEARALLGVEPQADEQVELN